MSYGQHIWESMSQMPFIDWVSVLAGLAYLILAAREHIACWYFAFVSTALWAYSAYVNYQLYLDAALQIYYLIMAVYGYWWWKRPKQERPAGIQQMQGWQHLLLILGGLLLSLGSGWLLQAYTDAQLPYWDALTTVFSLGITFLVAQKYIENWLYWFVIDGIYIWLYAQREAYLFSLLFIIYEFIVLYGYWDWRQRLKKQRAGWA